MGGLMRKHSKESMELAFMVYSAMGGRDIRLILERLERYGLKITARTLHKWKRQGRWEERTGKVQKEKSVGFKQEMLQRLTAHIERLDSLLKETSGINPQEVYALVTLVAAAVRLHEKTPKKTDPEEMRRRANEILETEFGIMRD